MTRILVPLAVVALAYVYWKYIAFAPAEMRKKRMQVALTWGLFALGLAFAARSGSATWLIGAGVVMVVMRLLATVGRQRSARGASNASPNDATRRRNSPMSRAEALQMFELGDTPTAEAIQKRYKELMRGVHPDRGGSNYLAAQLNEAYRVLMADQG